MSAGAVGVILLLQPAGLAAGASANALPSQLVGTWTRTVTAVDLRRTHATHVHVGAWKLVIAKTGIAKLCGPGLTTLGGISVIGPTRVDIGGMEVPGIPYKSMPDVYSWKVSRGVLSLTRIKDPFSERAALLWGAWKRKSTAPTFC